MFQFTTTNVINSNKDFTTGKPLWSEGTDTTHPSLHIKRVNNFKKENVKAIYKAKANDAENAKVVINFDGLTDVKNGDQLRLNLYIGLTQGSNDSRYANDFYYKGKPFTIDFVWKGTDVTAIVKKLVNTINKYELLVYGDKLLDVEAKGKYLVIKAKDEFQRFRKLTLEKFDPVPHNGLGEYVVLKNIEDFDVVDTLVDAVDTNELIFKGKEGFGTYSYILRNLRLPTDMRTRAFGINQDETPIPGAKYNQYTIHYCVNRGIMGTNAVGDVVKSLTTHVFYVKEDLASDFEAALKKISPTDELTPATDADKDDAAKETDKKTEGVDSGLGD